MEELKKESLIHHLEALRRLILVAVAAVAAAGLGVYAFAYDWVYDLAQTPLRQLNITPVVIGVTEGFMVKLKLSFSFGLFFALPVILTAILLFIFPALYKKEKWAACVIFTAGTALFFAGVILAYRYILSLALQFFLGQYTDGLETMLSYDKYFSFVLNLLWPFGLIMEMPLVAWLLTAVHVLNPAAMRKKRKYVLVGTFVLAAIFTPPDVISQVMLALPMLALYEVSIGVSALTLRFQRVGRLRKEENQPPQHTDK